MLNRLKLARALAAALQPQLPPWLSVSASQEQLVLRGGGSRKEIFTWGGNESDAELCRTLGYHVLDELQDFISIETREPWPTPASGAPIPLPGCEVQDGRLRLYFGEPTSPALEFPSITLSDVLE